MGKTIEELFKTKVLSNGQTAEAKYDIRNSKDIPITTSNGLLNGTVFPIVQKTLRSSSTLTARLSEKRVEEELVGVRAIRGLASPVIYGTDLIRLKTRTTGVLTSMKNAANGGNETDNGILGNAINKVKDTAIQLASKIGIALPETMIPTKVSLNSKFIKGKETDTMITLAEIKKDGAGNLLGKAIKNSVNGTPNQIVNQVVGTGIKLIKDEVRKGLFGGRKEGAQNIAKNNIGEPTLYYSKNKYTSTIDARTTDIDTRNDLSSVLVLREKKAKTLKNLKDGSSEIPDVKTDILKPSDKINNVNNNPFASANDKLKSKEKDNNDKLAGGRKEGQQKLSQKPADELNNPNKPKYESGLVYSDTVDEEIDDIELRNDLSTKLNALNKANEELAKNGAGASGVSRSNDKLYSTIKNDENKSINIVNRIGYKNSKGDFVNEKIQYQGESLIIDGKSLDEYDFIPLKFTSVASNQSVNFRATITGLSETTSPTWDSAKFLGSPFNYYTYSGIERSVSFQFKVFSSNAAEHVAAWQRLDFLTSLTYPISYSNETYIVPPFLKFTLGNMYKAKACFIESLNYSVDDNIPWEIGYGGSSVNEQTTVTIGGETFNLSDYKLPTVVNVDITLKLIESKGTTKTRLYGFKRFGVKQQSTTGTNSEGKQITPIGSNDLANKPATSETQKQKEKEKKAMPAKNNNSTITSGLSGPSFTNQKARVDNTYVRTPQKF